VQLDLESAADANVGLANDDALTTAQTEGETRSDSGKDEKRKTRNNQRVQPQR
jgi:hypothetical protein